MPLQYAMLEYLPAEDTRLKEEAVSYFNLGGKLQLQSVGDMRLGEFQQKISKRLGMEPADWKSGSTPPGK